jgi:hypothetical protein
MDNAFLGQIPEWILIAMVKNTAFVGSANTNPFHFRHFDMTNFVLYVSGFQHPSEPLTMGSSSPFGATRAYESMFSSTGKHHDDRAHMITPEMFTKGFYVLGFDLTPDREADEEHTSPPRQGNVPIEARSKGYYLNPSHAFCMLNSQDTSRSTNVGTSQ